MTPEFLVVSSRNKREGRYTESKQTPKCYPLFPPIPPTQSYVYIYIFICIPESHWHACILLYCYLLVITRNAAVRFGQSLDTVKLASEQVPKP